PPLATYNVVTPKEAAETILISPNGDPLLAQWQYGNGRAVAWTSNLRPDWAGEWATWSQRDRFWGQVARYAMGSPTDPGLGLRADTQADRVRVTLDAINDDGTFVNRATVAGLVVAPSGRSLPLTLRQTGPGRYEAEFQTPESGAHDIQVTVVEPGQPPRRENIAAITVVDPEARAFGVNERLLSRLTGVTGGRQLSDPASAFADGPRPTGERHQPMWQWLLGAALLALVAEIAVRRLRGVRLW
ncbi:MAG: FixH family protein, partial [Dehalococcoidia bacterium]|nr:FixH family protein [Dehalococcoidia bacterium]